MQRADPLDIAQRGLVEQVGLPAHDQHRAALRILAPYRQPALDQVAAGFVELAAARGDLIAHRPRSLGQRAPGKPRRKIVARAFQSRCRVRPVECDNAVLDLPILPDQHRQRSLGRERHQGHLRRGAARGAGP